MRKNIKNNFILVFFSSILFSCSNKNNDIDLSNLPVIKPEKVVDTKKVEVDSSNSNENEFIRDLIPFKKKEKVLSKLKFGKVDPFSESKFEVTKLSEDFKLTGFLNTKLKKYVFVRYLGNEGTISENSIGGLNTNLLPKGAKVIDIDPKALKITINHKNENFVFEL